MHTLYPIVLGSGSPRRKELLSQLIPTFDILVGGVDEEALTGIDPRQTAEELAEAKAEAVFEMRPDAFVIGADTVVAFEEGGVWVQLAKPRDEADARAMLAKLSGRSHLVITGFSFCWPEGCFTSSESTQVRFRELSADEIAAYVATGEPMDKAGGYAIQGGAAGFVESVVGSISNVIGLPMERVSAELERLKLGIGASTVSEK